MVQTAQGLPDAGGVLELFYGVTAEGPWESQENALWVEDYNWGQIIGLNAGWYTCTETGNGTRYVGTSEMAIPFEV